MVEYEFEEIRTAIARDKEAENVGWMTLFKTPGNRRRLRIMIAIAFFSQWSGNGLISYYLNKVFDGIGITNPTTQLLINGILQIYNLCIAMCASFLVERLGRRILFISSCVGMLIFFSCMTACAAVFANTGNKGAANAVIAFIFLFNGAYAYVIPLFYVYVTLILITSMTVLPSPR